MTIDDEQIRDAVERYEREYDRYAKLAARIADICRGEIVEANAIRAQVTFRAKSPRSFEGKLKRKRSAFSSVDDVFSTLADLAAVRVATYEKDDEARVVREIVKRFGETGALAPLTELKDKHEHDSTNFYRATHCLVTLPERDLVGSYSNLRGTACEIQVCSVMAHVWNEIEHDLGYKPTTGSLTMAEIELLSTLGHLTRAGDGIITSLLSATDARLAELTGEFEDVHDFVARMRKRFPVKNFALHAGQLLEELEAIGLDSPTKLDEQVLGDPPVGQVAEQAFLRGARAELGDFDAWLRGRQDSRYELEVDSSDLLLVQVLEVKAPDIVASHPVGRGLGGPSRVVWFAKRFPEYLASKNPIDKVAPEQSDAQA